MVAEFIAGKHCPICLGTGEEIGLRDNIMLRSCCNNLLSWAWNSVEEYYKMYSKDDEYHVKQQVIEGH